MVKYVPNISHLLSSLLIADIQMQLQGTNTYLVGSGREKILIDTGEGQPEWAENIAQVIDENDLEVSTVLITHWHGDHTGGIADLIAMDPELAGRIYKNDPDSGQNDIHDGQIFSVEGASIRAVHTPGHAYDHMCFVLEEENAIFTGDNVLGHGFTVVEDLKSYMISLDVMEGQKCAIGYPGHGVVIDDMPEKMHEYKGQKVRREQAIVSAMERFKKRMDGPSQGSKASVTVRDVVGAVHGFVPPEISALALEPFTKEVLWKLAEDRKVGFELKGGEKRWFLKQSIAAR